MSLEITLQPENKTITLDSSVRGSSSGSGSNFEHLFKAYTLDNRKILGTKADVFNVDGLFRDLKKQYQLEPGLSQKIKEDLEQKFFQVSDGYAVVFWDKTSEVHHRDIMRHIYRSLANSVAKESDKKPDDLSLISLYVDLEEAVDQMYERKMGSATVDLTPMAKTLLRYAQGYQLSSVDEEDNQSLWKSKIMRLQLDSGITKDQIKFDVEIPRDEMLCNIQTFLDSLENVEFVSKKIEVPKEFGLEGVQFSVLSASTYSNDSGQLKYRITEDKIRTQPC